MSEETTRLCYNYETEQYEYIDRDGYSEESGEYCNSWDDSPYFDD